MGTPDPRPPEPPSRVKARTLVVVTLGAVLLTALLNCDQIVKRAEQMPFGWQRNVALRLADADRDVSRSLWLDRPRVEFDHLFGHQSLPVSAGPPKTTPTTPPPGPTTTTGPTSSTVEPAAPRRPTVSDPVTVYIGGDSVGEQLGDGFEQLIGGNRAVQLTDDGHVSSGLTRPDYFNWPARIRQVLGAPRPPEVVVVMFGANDVQPIATPSGPASVGTAAWLAEYSRRVAATMDVLSASGADVYWVGQPLMQSAYFSMREAQLDEIYASEAGLHPGITFVDTRPVLANQAGRYSAYLPNASGQMVQVRQADGVHLTMAGAARVAEAIEAAMRPRWILSGS